MKSDTEERYPSVQSAPHPRSGETIKVGDAVACYRAGIWKVTHVFDRSAEFNETGPPHDRKRTPRTALVRADQVLSGDFTKPKRSAKGYECDIAHCCLVTAEDLERWRDEEHKARTEGIRLFRERMGQ